MGKAALNSPPPKPNQRPAGQGAQPVSDYLLNQGQISDTRSRRAKRDRMILAMHNYGAPQDSQRRVGGLAEDGL